jgi:hypothetical protein
MTIPRIPFIAPLERPTSRVTHLSRRSMKLWLARGIPPTVVEQMLPFVTVFSNLASINILDAAPQVAAALAGMSPELLQEVLAQRGDPTLDPKSLLEVDREPRSGDAGGLESLSDLDRGGIRRRAPGRGGGRDPASRKR